MKWRSGSLKQWETCPVFFAKTTSSRRDTQCNRAKEAQTVWYIDQGEMGDIGKFNINFFCYQEQNQF